MKPALCVIVFIGFLGMSFTAELPSSASASESSSSSDGADIPVIHLDDEPLANIEFNLKTIQWIGLNETEGIVPESPDEATSSVPVTLPITVDEDDNVNITDTISFDLRTQGVPGYCRCINKYYCLPPKRQRPTRTERAVNTPLCQRDEVMCCSTGGLACGVSSPFPYFIPYPSYGEANFAEYPWTAVVMDTNNQFIFGLGVIVTPNLILTTARNLEPYIGTPLKVRLGEWDLTTNDEPFKPLEASVKEAVIHPGFNKKTFQNDLALLRLRSPLDLDQYPHIRSACLARPEDATRFTGAKCWVAGWGIKPSERQQERNLLKEVDMKVLDPKSCEAAIRNSIGNPDYYFDQKSFVCAGGEAGKGLCKGDEGAAIVCQNGPESRYTVVGLTSWGTSCGQPGFPAVFTNLATQFEWIRSVELSAGQQFGSGSGK